MRYDVKIARVVEQTAWVNVEADSEEAAGEAAIEKANDFNTDWEDESTVDADVDVLLIETNQPKE